ncbi:MAG: hydrolase [Proteobacteria bacterium]|nr:hydrolase [Pseudomonadota bacterium]
MLKRDNTVLVVVDVQEKLFNTMHEKEALSQNLQKIVEGIQVLQIPIVWMEQNPKGLGPTLPEIADRISDNQPIPKMSFGCCGEPNFMKALTATKRRQVLIVGIETHVCVYQTAAELKEKGYEVEVAADAVSSRTFDNKHIGLEKIRDAGAGITSVETALFELLGAAEGPEFKQMLKVVK